MVRSFDLPPTYTARDFLLIKESLPAWNATKRIKQILDAEYKKINLQTIVMSLSYLKIEHKDFILELFQKY